MPAELHIAVTGLEGRDNPYPGVSIARSLQTARGDRIRLLGLAYAPTLTGCFRRDVFDAIAIMPLPGDPPSMHLRRLLELKDEYGIDVLIPALDSEVPVYAAYSDRLAAAGIRTFLPPPASVRARLKDRLASFCERHGIGCPRTEVIADPATFFARPDLTYPLFVKGSVADAVAVENAADGVAAYWRLAARWGFPILAQESVPGEEVDVCAVAGADGAVVAMAAMKKLARSGAGKAVAGVFLDDEEIEREARRIIRALRWRGPLELELMQDPASRRLVLIEVNARLPAWVGAATAAGLNLPDVVLRLALGEPAAPAVAIRPGAAFLRTSRTTISRIEELGRLASAGVLNHTPRPRAKGAPA